MFARRFLGVSCGAMYCALPIPRSGNADGAFQVYAWQSRAPLAVPACHFFYSNLRTDIAVAATALAVIAGYVTGQVGLGE